MKTTVAATTRAGLFVNASEDTIRRRSNDTARLIARSPLTSETRMVEMATRCTTVSSTRQGIVPDPERVK